MLSRPPTTPKVANPNAFAPTVGISRLSSTPAAMPDNASGSTMAPNAVPRGSSASAATTSSTRAAGTPDNC